MSMAGGMGLQLLGQLYNAAFQGMADEKANNEINRLTDVELGRQDKYLDKNMGLYSQEAVGANPKNKEKRNAKNVGTRQAKYNAGTAQPVGPALQMNNAYATRGAVMKALLNSSRAKLMGRKDTAMQDDRNSSLINTLLAVNNDFSRTSAGIAPYEIAQGQYAGSGYRMAGNLLASLTNMGGSMLANK